MAGSAYKIENLSKTYLIGDRAVPVLHQINLDIDQGQFVAVMGPSGSGKSTLMQMLGCLDHPTSGTVKILNHDISTLTDDQSAYLRCHTIGFVFQNFHLLPYYDATANVLLPMVYKGLKNPGRRAENLLKNLGLSHRLHHFPREMSGGEKQRVAIARAIANKPKIILADEPTGALDQANGKLILKILSDLHRAGTTIILVTHDIEVAHQAERIVEFLDGHISKDYVVRK